MRINYQILWLEDSTEWLEAKIDDIKDYLGALGFELVLTVIPKYEVKDFSVYDIIVVDLSLENEEGTDAIKIIRNREKIFTDILFYSQYGEASLRKKMALEKIDGVYCANRRNCPDKLKKLIDTTVKKAQEINNLRGLVMAETSQLDDIVKDILLKYKWDEKKSTEILDKIKKRYCDIRDELNKHTPPINMSLLINNVNYFQANFSFFCLEEIVGETLWKDIKEYEEIIKIRNILAHGKEISSSTEKIVLRRIRSNKKIEEITYTSQDFITIRKKIREFRAKFEKIQKK